MSSVRRVDAPAPSLRVTSEILDREPPFNLDAERGVLASILLLPDVCDDVALILRPDDFYDDANRKIFEHMLAMHDEGKKIDTTLLVERLKSAGDFEAIGGPAYMGRVIPSAPHAAHAIHYSRIVQQKATYRSLINAATEILRDAYDESGDAKELLSQSEQKIFSILDGRGTSSVNSIRDVLHEAMDQLDARLRGEHTFRGVDTGFPGLDDLTGGLHNSELIILAARPSMGKTAFAMNIAENVAIKYKVPTLYISLEMSAMELCDRLLSAVSHVDGFKMREGRLNQRDRKRIVEKAREISEAPFYVDDSPSRTVTEIAAAARRIRRRENRLGLIVIDYLQLIQPDNPKDPRQEQVAKITRRLKGVAREMDVPVLCIAQLNRQAETGKDTRPRLSHLRESGAIEQDADIVMFVHRDEYYDNADEQNKGQAEIIVAKQRNGPVGKVELLWHKQFTKFVTPASEHRAEPEYYDEPGRHAEFDEYNEQDDRDDF